MRAKSIENRLRCRLKRQGYLLRKSRKRNVLTIDDWGGYMIITPNGWIVAGEHFDLYLEDVQRFVEE